MSVCGCVWLCVVVRVLVLCVCGLCVLCVVCVCVVMCDVCIVCVCVVCDGLVVCGCSNAGSMCVRVRVRGRGWLVDGLVAVVSVCVHVLVCMVA